ncbi:hypothetical protein J8F10_30425 [Gemmata sp. G18]|uniref:Sigma-70 family RNA polymerase sigma factor n=1 Tax=Gemmata palustris TaxID=2822762 RepID=A0ABS5C0S0_9BACT|nr:hypothetical protein [Gemmata palustris]MBP3959582.1 hypothetical protein [Gemmata palustris]
MIDQQSEAEEKAPVVAVPDDLFERAYLAAMRVAEGWGRKRPDISEELIDAATSATLWARANCRCLATFPAFCSRAVRTWLRRQSHREKLKKENRPQMVELGAVADRARVTKPANPVLIEDLDTDTAFIVRLYTEDGFTIREIALLTGKGHSIIHVLLHKAAERIAGGRERAPRRAGEKRLSAG